MRDAYDVLKQKEEDLTRVRNEVESLRIVALLLGDDLDSDPSDKMNSAEKTDDHLSDNLLNLVRKTRPESELTGAGGHVFLSILNQKKRA